MLLCCGLSSTGAQSKQKSNLTDETPLSSNYRIRVLEAKYQQNYPCVVWMNALCYHLPQHTHTHTLTIFIPFALPRVLTCSQQAQLLLPGDAEPQTVQRAVIRVAASRGTAEMSAVISGEWGQQQAKCSFGAPGSLRGLWRRVANLWATTCRFELRGKSNCFCYT